MSLDRIHTPSSLSLAPAMAAVAILASSLPGVASAAATDALDAHYFFGTPSGTSLLPPSLPEVPGAGSYTEGPATATFTLAPEPSVRLDVSGPTFVGAAFEYSYSITGPGSVPFDTVDGSITTSMSATGTGYMVAAAALIGTGVTLLPPDTVDPAYPTVLRGACYSTLGVCPDAFGSSVPSQAIDVSFASTGMIEIATAAKVFSGTASAVIDPVITLPEGYTLTLTPGVGNGGPVVPPPVSAVPEPTTLVSMALGLAALGIVRRRQRPGAALA